MAPRQCPHCGAHVSEFATYCPNCRESLQGVQAFTPHRPPQGGPEIRRGLLYMLLAAVLYYFAGGHSPLEFPVPFAHFLTDYLLPFLFLCGLGLVAFGLYRRVRG